MCTQVSKLWSTVLLFIAFFVGLIWSFRAMNVSTAVIVAVAACGSVLYLGLFYLLREVVLRSERQTSVGGRVRQMLLFLLLAIVNIGLWGLMHTYLSGR